MINFNEPAVMYLHILNNHPKHELFKELNKDSLIHISYSDFVKQEDWNKDVLDNSLTLRYSYNLPIKEITQNQVTFLIDNLKQLVNIKNSYLTEAYNYLQEPNFNYLYTYIINNLTSIENKTECLKLIAEHKDKVDLHLLREKYYLLDELELGIATFHFGMSVKYNSVINDMYKNNLSSFEELEQKEQVVIAQQLEIEEFDLESLPEHIKQNIQSVIKDTSTLLGRLYSIKHILCHHNEKIIDTAINLIQKTGDRLHYREFQKRNLDLEKLGMNNVRKSVFVTIDDLLLLKKQQFQFAFELIHIESEKEMVVKHKKDYLLKLNYNEELYFYSYDYIGDKELVDTILIDTDNIFKSLIFLLNEVVFD